MDLDALTSCAELTDEHADAAAETSASMRAFLQWASRTAHPDGGAPRLLMAFGRLVGADWVEGTPLVEITGSETVTKISVYADHGMGIRERMLPVLHLSVSFEEFEQALMIRPELPAPLIPISKDGAIVLSPAEVDEETRELIAIDARSLHEQDRPTQPPPPPVTGPIPKSLVNDESGVHTHPTVRRMIAVRPEALRRGGDDD